jgi:hypothetical protein
MEQIIDKINVVVFEITSISGTVTRDAQDDPKVFTAGSVRYINPDELKVFMAARQNANRACRNRGVRFLSGWAVPDEAVEPLVAELNPIAQKVEQAKANLITGWDEKLREWEELQPQVIPYRSRFPTREHVARQTGARLSVYRIHPATVVSDAKDGIQVEVEGLADRVLHEIAQDVQSTWKPNATQASQRIKNLLGRLASKCRTLEFLGRNLGSMASFIDEAITRLPANGAIQGADFAVLAGILTILSSPERMREISETISGSSIAAVEPLFVKPDSESDAETEDEAIDEDNQPVHKTAGQTPKPVNLNTTEAWSW